MFFTTGSIWSGIQGLVSFVTRRKSPSPKQGFDFASKRKSLEERRKRLSDQRPLQNTSVDWFYLSSPDEEKKPIGTFHPYKFNDVLNLQTLEEIRLKKEAEEQERLKKKTTELLAYVENCFGNRNAAEASKSLSKVRAKLVQINDAELRQKYQELQVRLNELEKELEQEELARLAEERRRKEEEDRERKQAEELARKEQERKDRQVRERREAEARKRAEEARKKVDAERAERQRLESLSSDLKEDWQDFKRVLDVNGVRYFYHFTDDRNILSIKRRGGLLSWYYCQEHHIDIPCPGGDYGSRELDKKYELQDYVRLSFCDDHPMKHRLEQSGSEMRVLKIKIDVAFIKDTQFSDMNATDKRHTHGKQLRHLQMVDFDATKKHFLRKDDPKFKPHQAEVMVKTFIPLKYIENI